MSVVVAGAASSTRYRAWDPTQRQVREPDTLYLQDMDVEALLTPWEGGMLGANEVTGATIEKPPWRGGEAGEVVPGKYRDGVRAAGARYLILPATGMLSADQWTMEFFVSSAVAWASLPSSIAVQLWNDYHAYILVNLNAGTIFVQYRHEQAQVDVFKQVTISGQTFAADVQVSVALTLAASTLRIYVNGVLRATVADCTPPRIWADSWNAPYGGLWFSTNPDLTISDLRTSRLARVPGEVPAP